MTDRQIRPFADFLVEFDEGASHDELSTALNELVSAVHTLGKVGTLTYSIKVKPAGRNSGATVMITDDIRLKLPTGERAETVWFVDSNGNVSRNNPMQERLPLKEVPRPDMTVEINGKQVATTTGEVVS